ncbi:phosphatidylserine/phosphatidylglycerophosphate/cardiolipin synthase family protein [Nocardia sp. NPDC020380]|uniref:phosphatidylserine/phosphatidylglycerophosphate/ cardiolipin synthase family protein n=1 Tax=Nocardia sp. NPDC020380 TaxID=3364309 RepID=UPI00379BEA0F
MTAGCGGLSQAASGTGQATSVTDGAYQLIQEPADGYQAIDDLISSAHTALDMTMYEFTDATALQALIADQQRGVQVRVLLDQDFAGRKTNLDTMNQLTAAGIAAKWAPTNVIVHQKSIVVDGTVAAIGTGNLTSRYYSTSRDAWIFDSSAPQVSAVESTFDADFDAADNNELGSATQADGLIWSPGAQQPMVTAIESAQTSVDFTSEELADPAIIDALAADASRGVNCRIVMTDSASWKTGFTKVTAAGCQVHVYAPDASLYIHEKQILTDGTDLTIGSQNASASSLNRNRELSIHLTTATTPTIISTVSSTFDQDFDAAPAWTGK